MNILKIDSTQVLIDDQGRYLLNAIHRASGGDPSHRPSNWLRLKSTDDLVNHLVDAQISASPINVIKGGINGQGTFAHELLVVSYAGWISPQFQIKVNQIFLNRNKPQFAIPQTLSEALQLASDQAKQLELQAPKVNYYDKVAKNTTHLNATQVAQKVGLSAVTMNKHLTELKVYNKSIKRGKAFNQWFIDDGYGEMKQTALGYSQAVFTVKGEQYIIELLTSEGIV